MASKPRPPPIQVNQTITSSATLQPGSYKRVHYHAGSHAHSTPSTPPVNADLDLGHIITDVHASNYVISNPPPRPHSKLPSNAWHEYVLWYEQNYKSLTQQYHYYRNQFNRLYFKLKSRKQAKRRSETAESTPLAAMRAMNAMSPVSPNGTEFESSDTETVLSSVFSGASRKRFPRARTSRSIKNSPRGRGNSRHGRARTSNLSVQAHAYHTDNEAELPRLGRSRSRSRNSRSGRSKSPSSIHGTFDNFDEKQANDAPSDRIESVSNVSPPHELSQVGNYVIKNPLVVMLGIGEYHGQMEDLKPSVKQDYSNVIETFCDSWGYNIYYATDDGSMRYMSKNFDEGHYYTNFKVDWTEKEIEDFTFKARECLVNNKHDSLIYLISAHGDSEGVITTSDLVEVSLVSIYHPFFSGQCHYLSSKPKVFFIDACRGTMQAPSFATKGSTSFQETQRTPETRGPGKSGNSDNSNNSANSHKPNMPEKPDKSENMDATKDLKINAIQEANCRFIYGNPEGYAVFSGGNLGGYLIRCTKHVMKENVSYDRSKTLSKLILMIRHEVDELVGSHTNQIVEDHNLINYEVTFQIRNSYTSNEKMNLSHARSASADLNVSHMDFDHEQSEISFKNMESYESSVSSFAPSAIEPSVSVTQTPSVTQSGTELSVPNQTQSVRNIPIFRKSAFVDTKHSKSQRKPKAQPTLQPGISTSSSLSFGNAANVHVANSAAVSDAVHTSSKSKNSRKNKKKKNAKKTKKMEPQNANNQLHQIQFNLAMTGMAPVDESAMMFNSAQHSKKSKKSKKSKQSKQSKQPKRSEQAKQAETSKQSNNQSKRKQVPPLLTSNIENDASGSMIPSNAPRLLLKTSKTAMSKSTSPVMAQASPRGMSRMNIFARVSPGNSPRHANKEIQKQVDQFNNSEMSHGRKNNINAMHSGNGADNSKNKNARARSGAGRLTGSAASSPRGHSSANDSLSPRIDNNGSNGADASEHAQVGHKRTNTYNFLSSAVKKVLG